MKEIIENIAKSTAEDFRFMLIKTKIKGVKKTPEIEVFIDSKVGVGTNDCAEFSRKFKEKLETSSLNNLDYQLVVSSPGTEEPLIYLEQYFKNISREFKLSFDDGEKVQSIEAKLNNIKDDTLFFEYKKKEIEIKFINIKKAKVKTSF
ncbi:MAG: hypothetical protein CR986_04055 [Ignavibacteriae bacterium]|nr:MAG: hypothetical protein CR986_04055 [Ignavibacteriota bacterium]